MVIGCGCVCSGDGGGAGSAAVAFWSRLMQLTSADQRRCCFRAACRLCCTACVGVVPAAAECSWLGTDSMLQLVSTSQHARPPTSMTDVGASSQMGNGALSRVCGSRFQGRKGDGARGAEETWCLVHGRLGSWWDGAKRMPRDVTAACR